VVLQKEEMGACELQVALGFAQSSVSAHLRILEDEALVESRKDGLRELPAAKPG